eukprot:215261-Pelagomonas_calceolata.AAC.2
MAHKLRVMAESKRGTLFWPTSCRLCWPEFAKRAHVPRGLFQGIQANIADHQHVSCCAVCSICDMQCNVCPQRPTLGSVSSKLLQACKLCKAAL